MADPALFHSSPLSCPVPQFFTDLMCIGSGKFATVHRAFHKPTGTNVALKKVQVYSPGAMRERAAHEACVDAT